MFQLTLVFSVWKANTYSLILGQTVETFFPFVLVVMYDPVWDFVTNGISLCQNISPFSNARLTIPSIRFTHSSSPIRVCLKTAQHKVSDTTCSDLIIFLFRNHLVIVTGPGQLILVKKTTSYLTFSSGTGIIDEWTEVIIEVGIDHRMQNQYWSAVLIHMVVVDEVKWLSVLVRRWGQGNDSLSRWVFIEGLRLLSSGLCWGSVLNWFNIMAKIVPLVLTFSLSVCACASNLIS